MPRAEIASVRAVRANAIPVGQPLSLVGSSTAAASLRAAIDAAALAPCVLFEGEMGLDLLDLARDLHRRASAGPFVAVDCGGADPASVVAELFGDPVPGDPEAIDLRSALARAIGGTLYLEDVPLLPEAAQDRLARLINDGEAVVGDSRRQIGLRVIASAGVDVDVDPETRVRRELLRRFAGARVAIVSLRQRADDLPLMIGHLVAAACADAGLPSKTMTPDAVTLLAAMPWHGNVAELRHSVGRLVNTVDALAISLDDVLLHVRFDGTLVPRSPSGTLRTARQQFERDYIALVLRRHRWRIGEAARTLGMQRTNLYRKARQLGIAVTRPGYRA